MLTRLSGLRPASLFALIALIAGLPGCGGSSTGPTATVTPTPTPPPVTTVIFQSAFPPLDPGDFVFANFSISGAGAVRATMDWTFPTNQMFFLIMSGTTCGEQEFIAFIQQGQSTACTPLGVDLDPSTKPGVITFNVTQATNARVFVVNTGPGSESGVVQIALTR